jgi:hypothetical protein
MYGVKSVEKRIFILGGCRSGKSSYALETAKKFSVDRNVFNTSRNAAGTGLRWKPTSIYLRRLWRLAGRPAFCW